MKIHDLSSAATAFATAVSSEKIKDGSQDIKFELECLKQAYADQGRRSQISARVFLIPSGLDLI